MSSLAVCCPGRVPGRWWRPARWASRRALAAETAAPSIWVFAGGMVVFGVGFGALDAALNAHAAAQRAAAAAATRVVSLQVAASAGGNAALPAGLGLVIGALAATALGPSLLPLSLVLAGLHGWLTRVLQMRVT